MARKSRLLFSKHKNIFHNASIKNIVIVNNKQNSFKKLSRSKRTETPVYYKPTGLSQLQQLSKFLKRSINLWSNDRLIYTFGKYPENLKINVEYVENQLTNDNQCNQCLGHYALKGKKEPCANEIKYPNNCAFDVIASQTGVLPNALRQVTIKEARKKLKAKLLKRRLSTSKRFPIALAIRGGARYSGKTKTEAKNILDSSQKGESHPRRQSGHPRGHASYAGATGSSDSVENYSKYGRKTGFLSRSDQDFVAHLMLKTSAARDAMDVLNELGKKASRESVKIRPQNLEADDDDIPQAQEWIDGKRKGEPSRIRDVVLVMKHFYEKYDDERANVFVLTMYPRL